MKISLYALGKEYNELKDRTTNPEGSFDKGGRWYPEAMMNCCDEVRSPSRAWPYSLLVHARSAKHIAAKHGITEYEVKRAAYLYEHFGSDLLIVETAIVSGDLLIGETLTSAHAKRMIEKFFALKNAEVA